MTEPHVLAVVCGYELAALATGKLPTITNLVCRLPRRARSVVAVSAGVWLFLHFDRR